MPVLFVNKRAAIFVRWKVFTSQIVILHHYSWRMHASSWTAVKQRTVTKGDIDWESMKGLPEAAVCRARSLDFHFPSFVSRYENGVAQVRWELNPDGMYYMDEDGYGMTDDDEVDIYGFIDRMGNVVVKFKDIHNDRNLLKAMRMEAEAIVNQ